MICDWCGKKHPETLQVKKDSHVLKNYVHKPIICKDCYKLIKEEKIASLLAKEEQFK